jgi:hypothetical protein
VQADEGVIACRHRQDARGEQERELHAEHADERPRAAAIAGARERRGVGQVADAAPGDEDAGEDRGEEKPL